MDNKKFFVQHGLITGPINLDAETGNITTTGEISTENLTVNGKLTAHIKLEDLAISDLTINDQLRLVNQTNEASFSVSPSLIEFITNNSPFLVINRGINTHFGVISNNKELFKVEDSQVSSHVTLSALGGISTGRISMRSADASVDFSLRPRTFEIFSNNTPVVFSNAGENARVVVLNDGKETLLVKANETILNVKLEAKDINAAKVSAHEFIGRISTESQTGIREVGILRNLSVESNVAANTVVAHELTVSDIHGTVRTSEQSEITLVGNLSTLRVEGIATFDSEINMSNVVIRATDSMLIVQEAITVDVLYTNTLSSPNAVTAEYFQTDGHYDIGTVLDFGGNSEVTLSNVPASQKVAGIVVDSNCALILNNTLVSGILLGVSGIAPCRVSGQVRKGSLLVSAGDGTARADSDPRVGTVIAKAMADHYGTVGMILVKLMTA